MKLGYVKLRRILIGQAMSICLRLDPGCNPAPGAWTNYGERKLYLFEARNIVAWTFGHGARAQDRRVVSAGGCGVAYPSRKAAS
jgi:hypothetical protein